MSLSLHHNELAHDAPTNLIHELGNALGTHTAPRGSSHQEAPRLGAGVAVLAAGEGCPVQLIACRDVADEAGVEALCIVESREAFSLQ